MNLVRTGIEGLFDSFPGAGTLRSPANFTTAARCRAARGESMSSTEQASVVVIGMGSYQQQQYFADVDTDRQKNSRITCPVPTLDLTLHRPACTYLKFATFFDKH